MKTKSFAWRKSILCHGNFIDTSHLYMLQVLNTFCHLFSKQLIPGKGCQRWSEGWRVCDSHAPPQVREWEGERKRKEVAERCVDLDLTNAQCPRCQLGIALNRAWSDQSQIVGFVVWFTKRFVLMCSSQSKEGKNYFLWFSNSNLKHNILL